MPIDSDPTVVGALLMTVASVWIAVWWTNRKRR